MLQQCDIIELNDEEFLFKQNDRADAMYILISGYLIITVEHENHNVEHISSVHPGEVTGELGLFSNKPRSASAKALLVGSVDHYRRNLKHVNYHISSDLSNFSLFIFDQDSIQKLIKTGYDAANDALKDINKSINIIHDIIQATPKLILQVS